MSRSRPGAKGSTSWSARPKRGLAPRVVHADESQRSILSAFVVDRSVHGALQRPVDPAEAPRSPCLDAALRGVHDLPHPARIRREGPARAEVASIWSGIPATVCRAGLRRRGGAACAHRRRSRPRSPFGPQPQRRQPDEPRLRRREALAPRLGHGRAERSVLRPRRDRHVPPHGRGHLPTAARSTRRRGRLQPPGAIHVLPSFGGRRVRRHLPAPRQDRRPHRAEPEKRRSTRRPHSASCTSV